MLIPNKWIAAGLGLILQWMGSLHVVKLKWAITYFALGVIVSDSCNNISDGHIWSFLSVSNIAGKMIYVEPPSASGSM